MVLLIKFADNRKDSHLVRDCGCWGICLFCLGSNFWKDWHLQALLDHHKYIFFDDGHLKLTLSLPYHLQYAQNQLLPFLPLTMQILIEYCKAIIHFPHDDFGGSRTPSMIVNRGIFCVYLRYLREDGVRVTLFPDTKKIILFEGNSEWRYSAFGDEFTLRWR